jgi:hypothetical protein
MHDTSRAAPMPQAIPGAGWTFYATVTAVREDAYKEGRFYNTLKAGDTFTAELITFAPMPFHGAFDVTIKPAPADKPRLESES